MGTTSAPSSAVASILDWVQLSWMFRCSVLYIPAPHTLRRTLLDQPQQQQRNGRVAVIDIVIKGKGIPHVSNYDWIISSFAWYSYPNTLRSCPTTTSAAWIVCVWFGRSWIRGVSCFASESCRTLSQCSAVRMRGDMKYGDRPWISSSRLIQWLKSHCWTEVGYNRTAWTSFECKKITADARVEVIKKTHHLIRNSSLHCREKTIIKCWMTYGIIFVIKKKKINNCVDISFYFLISLCFMLLMMVPSYSCKPWEWPQRWIHLSNWHSAMNILTGEFIFYQSWITHSGCSSWILFHLCVFI